MQSPGNEPDEYLVQHIRDALLQDKRVGEQDIHVTLASDGRHVMLTGTVSTPERQQVISEVVREVCPGREVHNAVSVVASPEPTDEEVLS